MPWSLSSLLQYPPPLTGAFQKEVGLEEADEEGTEARAQEGNPDQPEGCDRRLLLQRYGLSSRPDRVSLPVRIRLRKRVTCQAEDWACTACPIFAVSGPLRQNPSSCSSSWAPKLASALTALGVPSQTSTRAGTRFTARV